MPVLQPELLLRTPSVSPLALLAVLTSKYENDWITNDFHNVLRELEEDLGKIHPLVQEKLRALRVCAHTAAPWNRFEVFSPVMQALNGLPTAFNRHVQLDPHQLALGINVIDKLRASQYSDEIGKYVAAAMMFGGLHIVPIPELIIAKPFFKPFNQSAQTLFDTIKDLPLTEVDVDITTNDGVQAVKGRAELSVYRENLREWRDHLSAARRLV